MPISRNIIRENENAIFSIKHTKVRAIVFLISLFFLPGRVASQTALDIPALETALNAASTDSARYNACIDLHNAFFVSDPVKSRQYAQRMLDLYRKTQDWARICKAYMGLARCARKQRDYSKVIFYDHEMLNAARRSGNNQLLFVSNRTCANDYLDNENYQQAMPYLREAERLARQLNQPLPLAGICFSYGYCYNQLKRYRLSIPYLRKAVELYPAGTEDLNRARAKHYLAESLFGLGQRDSVAALLESSLATFQRLNAVGSQADCFDLLAKFSAAEGDEPRVQAYRSKARELHKASNNLTEFALSGLDLAAQELAISRTRSVKALLTEAGAIFRQNNFAPGTYRLNALWADYYSQTGNRTAAERHFGAAASAMTHPDQASLRTELLWTLFEHYYRYGEKHRADSLLYAYGEYMAVQRDPEDVRNRLSVLKSKNKALDSTTLSLLARLYSPGGAAQLKKQLGMQSLTSALPLDALLQVNPYSMATQEYDSTMSVVFQRQLQDIEARYRVRQMQDSIALGNLRLNDAKQRLRIATISMAGIAVVSLLLVAGIVLQVRHRRRAERDRTEIMLLKDQVHHLVDNNLKIINRFVDVAAKPSESGNQLATLKSRIAAVELLHKRLYTTAPAGRLNLQDYLEDICRSDVAVFAPGADIEIAVRANVTVQSQLAGILGRIVAELLTNSLKYAFGDGRKGRLLLEVEPVENGSFRLHYADNGPGLAETSGTGHGMKYIRGMSHQIRGEYHFHNDGGSHFTLLFRSEQNQPNTA